jgi:hypothetical protein
VTGVATYTYGRGPDHYVEIPDPATPGQTIRPAAGFSVGVRDATTATTRNLPTTTTTSYGYLAFTTDTPIVRVSTDGFATWKTLVAEEALADSVTAGVDATQAATDAAAARTAVNALGVRVSTLEAGGGTGGGSSTFSGTVDWATQVTGKPTLTATALGALAASARGATEGVAPLAGGLVPFGNLPVGTTSTQVAPGAHTHAVSFANLPSTSGVRMAIEIDEVSAGVYPTLTAEQSRAGVKRVFNGQIRPTAAQGAQALDKWVNTGAA